MTKVIDLTKESTTCVEHPIVKLVRILNDASSKELIIIVSKDDIPSIKILEIIADRMKFKITDVFEDNEIIRAKFVKEN
ncbi:MAG: hypothetical protein QXL96_11745 [Ignisphaera sp.]